MRLPEAFLEHMKTLLGAEYEPWLASYEKPPYQGLRINSRKLDELQWERISPYGTRRVPWTPNGYYYDREERPAKDPYYYAGLYYLQEPSAMAPAAVLPVKPGDRVLDLCAAPGGKSTELGVRLQGKGLLVSNDISSSRAKALLKNLELFGLENICVTSEAPEKLLQAFGCFFDKILVDAPCSGEGMFRKDPELVKSWEEHGPEYYVPIQREILDCAVRLLRPGGYLLYSTCTFAREEDEDNILWLLSRYPKLSAVEVPLWEGAAGGLDGLSAVRLFPHRIRGEGHFLALLHKAAEADAPCRAAEAGFSSTSARERKLLEESDFVQWEQLTGRTFDRSRILVKADQVYYLPEGFDRSWNLRYLRTGLLLGELKKNRFEPSQAAAMALGSRDWRQCFSMKREDERVIRYLKGETILLQEGEELPKGWILVCVDGYALGWAKSSGASLKNKYHPGWRWQ